MLVCSSSNAACDEILTRLLGLINKKDILRLHAHSHNRWEVSEHYFDCSNWDEAMKKFTLPSLKYIYSFPVVICTLAVAGNLVRANGNVLFKPDHFSHVIIDECACTFETLTMVPIAGKTFLIENFSCVALVSEIDQNVFFSTQKIVGLCTVKNEIKSSIVFVGDPKQLDAVAKSDHARQLGFNKSLMEQLLDMKLYKRNKGKFNQNYITQLVKNYRCHPAILRKPSEMFYDGLLEPAALESEFQSVRFQNNRFKNQMFTLQVEQIGSSVSGPIHCYLHPIFLYYSILCMANVTPLSTTRGIFESKEHSFISRKFI